MSNVIAEIWREVVEDPKLLIYCLQDTAASPRLHPNLVLSQTDQACLFQGNLPALVAENAPYLARLRAGSPYARWFVRESWGHAWGLYCSSHAGIMELSAHFRRLLLARKEDGGLLQFRFYDPRVLSAYLPTCTAKELKQVFGPVEKFWMESGDFQSGGELLEFALHGESLRLRRVALAREAMPA